MNYSKFGGILPACFSIVIQGWYTALLLFTFPLYEKIGVPVLTLFLCIAWSTILEFFLCPLIVHLNNHLEHASYVLMFLFFISNCLLFMPLSFADYCQMSRSHWFMMCFPVASITKNLLYMVLESKFSEQNVVRVEKSTESTVSEYDGNIEGMANGQHCENHQRQQFHELINVRAMFQLVGVLVGLLLCTVVTSPALYSLIHASGGVVPNVFIDCSTDACRLDSDTNGRCPGYSTPSLSYDAATGAYGGSHLFFEDGIWASTEVDLGYSHYYHRLAPYLVRTEDKYGGVHSSTVNLGVNLSNVEWWRNGSIVTTVHNITTVTTFITDSSTNTTFNTTATFTSVTYPTIKEVLYGAEFISSFDTFFHPSNCHPYYTTHAHISSVLTTEQSTRDDRITTTYLSTVLTTTQANVFPHVTLSTYCGCVLECSTSCPAVITWGYLLPMVVIAISCVCVVCVCVHLMTQLSNGKCYDWCYYGCESQGEPQGEQPSIPSIIDIENQEQTPTQRLQRQRDGECKGDTSSHVTVSVVMNGRKRKVTYSSRDGKAVWFTHRLHAALFTPAAATLVSLGEQAAYISLVFLIRYYVRYVLSNAFPSSDDVCQYFRSSVITDDVSTESMGITSGSISWLNILATSWHCSPVSYSHMLVCSMIAGSILGVVLWKQCIKLWNVRRVWIGSTALAIVCISGYAAVPYLVDAAYTSLVLVLLSTVVGVCFGSSFITKIHHQHDLHYAHFVSGMRNDLLAHWMIGMHDGLFCFPLCLCCYACISISGLEPRDISDSHFSNESSSVSYVYLTGKCYIPTLVHTYIY